MKIIHCTTSFTRLSSGVLDRLNRISKSNSNFKSIVFSAQSNTSFREDFDCLSIYKLNKNIFLFSYSLFLFFLKCVQKKKELQVVLRYSPCAVYLWPIYLLFPNTIIEVHGIPSAESSTRKYKALRNLILHIDLFFLNLLERNYYAVTREIKDFISGNLNIKSVQITPNRIGYVNYREHLKQLLNNTDLHPPRFKYCDTELNKHLKILFLASNLSQPWQGIDVIIGHLARFSDSYPEFNIKLDIYGNDFPESLTVNSSRELTHPLNLQISFLGSVNNVQASFFDSYDLGFAPFALIRKGLRSSCSLKTRTYLYNGLPVVSNYPDDAFPLHVDLNRANLMGFYLFHNQLGLNAILKHIYHSKRLYPYTRKVRYSINAKSYLDFNLYTLNP